MILRPASSDDVPALARLGRDSFTAAFAHLYDPADLKAFLDEARAPDLIAAQIATLQTVFMVAEDEGGLIGYCSVHFDKQFDERPEPAPARPCVLSQLYTAPDATGRGIGAALIEWAIAEARERGRDAVQLSVWSENERAQKFYARYGFVKVADIDFWVGNHRDDEFLYELSLT